MLRSPRMWRLLPIQAAAALFSIVLSQQTAFAQRSWQPASEPRGHSISARSLIPASWRDSGTTQEPLPPGIEAELPRHPAALPDLPPSPLHATPGIPALDPTAGIQPAPSWKRATGHVMWAAPAAHLIRPDQPYDASCPTPYPDFRFGDGRRIRGFTGWLEDVRVLPNLRSDPRPCPDPGTYPVRVFQPPVQPGAGEGTAASVPAAAVRPSFPAAQR